MMKKIILLFAIASFSGYAFAQTPIATKDIGVDSVTTLEQRVKVWQLTIDTDAEMVIVVYRIETIAPNGVVVATSENKTYTRCNIVGDMRFDALRASQLGQMISASVANDLNSYPNLEQ